ncbi:MAG: YkgJ family cysteine cluster protein [Myxococcota bacterium]
MTLVPPLRADVRLEDTLGGGGQSAKALFDAALGRRVKLDAAGALIAAGLAQGRAMPAEELARAAGVEVAAVEKLAAGLARLHLLATPDADERVAVERMAKAPAAEVPILVRDDARFTCTMCGGCCGGHMVGPVSQKVLDGLDDHWPELERETGSRKGLFFGLPGGDDAAEVGRHVVCHSSGGSCVFLTDDRKCLIHKRFGGDKKPEPCRIFPYEMVATPTGVAVTIQRECRGFLEARQGKLLKDDLDDIRALVALAPVRPKVGAARRADGRVLPWAEYEALEARCHAVIDATGGDELATFSQLLAVFDMEAAGTATPGSDIASLRKDLDAWTAGFLAVLDMIAGHIPAADERVLIRTDGHYHLRRALRALRPDFRRVALPLERPEQRTLLQEHLHHALMGKALVQAPSLEAGLARLVAQWCLTKVMAIGRAREVKRRHLVAQDLMDALVVTSFMFRHADVAGVIASLEPQTTALFGARLSRLWAAARELPEPDARVELVKF